jgi:hypothetical protein
LTGTGGMSVITSGIKDTLSRLQVGVGSNHTITFGTNYGLIAGTSDSMVLTFSEFVFPVGLSYNDIDLTDNVGGERTLADSRDTDTWGVAVNAGAKTITFTTPTNSGSAEQFAFATQIIIKIGTNAISGGTGVNQISNPVNSGSYPEIITLNNASPGEKGDVSIPIVDSDTIDITGYVIAYMHFDIDTATGETPGPEINGSNNTIQDCAYTGVNACKVHGGVGALDGDNYTVDLGELSSAIVNKSNSTSVKHSDGGDGIINSIYFDISTNALGGVVVYVKSLNSGLIGPGSNIVYSIATDGQDIPANSGLYGYNLPVASSQLNGNIIKNTNCNSNNKYCGPISTPKVVFNTGGFPIDTARVRMDLAAAASYTSNPGTYTDTLTFYATATY